MRNFPLLEILGGFEVKEVNAGYLFVSPLHTRRWKEKRVVFVCGKRKKIFVCAYIFHIFLYMKATRNARHTIYMEEMEIHQSLTSRDYLLRFSREWKFSRVSEISEKQFNKKLNHVTNFMNNSIFVTIMPYLALTPRFPSSHNHPIKKRNKNAKKEIENG